MVWRRSAVKIYRALLLAYPAEFRHEYAPEMERLFADRLRSEPRLRVWLETLADIAWSAPKEHLHVAWGDLRYGARTLAKAPAFTAVALLAMAFGIGATTAVFSLVNAVLIRSLPYGDAERLVYVWTPNPRFEGTPREMTPFTADYYDWLRMSRSFSELALFHQEMLNVPGAQAAVRLGGARVTGNFFQTLRVSSAMGRTIDAEDDQPGHEHVAVISDRLWHSRFGGDPGVLGKMLSLNRESYQVVGVMPAAFVYPHDGDFPYGISGLRATDVWIPLAETEKQKLDRAQNPEDGVAIGRLRPGVTLREAQSEMSAIEARLDPLYPPLFRGWQAYVQPFVESAVGNVRRLLWLLFGAVSLVLLISCSNVANLLAARAAGRTYEMGVRTALGAERVRLVRQMLTEALLLAAGGGALGVLLALGGIRVLVRLNPGEIPRMDETSLDIRVLLFSAGITFVTGLLFGLLPALAASRVDVTALLKQGTRSITGPSKRLRSGLIVTEVALAVILLAGAGLLVRSYLNVLSVDTGFSASTLTMELRLDANYRTPGQRAALFRNLIGRIRTLPGVQSAGLVSAAPLSHHESITFVEVKGYPNRKDQTTDARSAGGGYFEAMDIHLLAGRFFTDDDATRKPPVVVVSRSFADLYFRGREAVGGQIRTGGRADAPWYTITGVVADVRHWSTEQAPKPTFYRPFFAEVDGHATLAIRSTLPPDRVTASVRGAVRSVDPTLALEQIRTMEQRVMESNNRRRFQTLVLAVFAAAAVFLALVGLYGLMAFAVKQRTAEVGLRLALGASRCQVLTMVLRQGLGLVAAGLALGLAAALPLTRVVAAWLYGVKAEDPLTFAAVPVMLLAVGLAACAIPAWKATRIDPVTALRYE